MSYLANPREDSPRPTHSPSEPSKETGGNILIIDDTPANLRLLAQILSDQGYKTRAVTSGSRALIAAQAMLPDLILLDVMMPEMGGYEVCRRLKANEYTRDIPVIFISALGETEDKIKAFTAGAVDYITKPFRVEEVLLRVQTHLALRDLQKQLQVANSELQRQLQELQARNEELNAYAHTVAHDLKSPMGTIVGFAGLLEVEAEVMPAEELKQYLGLIARKGRMMVNIIDELLLLAEVRQKEAPRNQLNMANILIAVQERLGDMVREYQAQLLLPSLAQLQNWPVTLGYGPWVVEVWVNYLSNAIKYGGRPPQVEVGMAVEAEGFVRFWVRDNGLGLSSEQQSSLFTPFVQLNQAQAKGYGLGLSIVKRIIEKLGGQVGVESTGQPGQGSLFFFTLPQVQE
jgi:signal transduction histidine kinase